jgi:glycosyltransferase involved in cell wall biosynthesis
MTESLIFAAHRAPVVLDGGAPIRAHMLLTGLAEAFDTTLVTFTHDPAHPDGAWTAAELEERFPGISVVTVPATFATDGAAKRRSQLISLPSPGSWAFGRYQLPAFGEALQATARATGARIIHYDHFGVALSGPVPGTLNVYSSHNVEHRIQQGMADVAGGVRKAFAELETRRVRREELRLWTKMDLCLAVSELDASAMRAAGAPAVDICLGGTDPIDSFELTTREPSEPLRMLFVGAGSYQPNEHGIAWFVQHVFPRIRDSIPAVLDVVGSPPNNPVRVDGVTYQGYVPSLENYYRDAHVAIVPLFFGSGTRGKIPEAMAYGTPVVSTTLGAEGLQVAPDNHYLRADTVEEFVSALVGVAERLTAPDRVLTTMIGDARAAAERHFWPNVVADLIETYHVRLIELSRAA